ncbi:MAG: PorT family protein, partial [Marinilabiliales bacterium]|nr:PorT family protein [Marinilabiliales bacterium]
LTYERYVTTPSAYIDVPIGVRYKGNRFGNIRPYIYGGAAFRRDLESKRISESVVHLNRNGYYAEVAIGLDTYFPFFRLSSEFRFSYGLNNLIRHDNDLSSSRPLPYYGYILEKLNSNIFTLLFYFE